MPKQLTNEQEVNAYIRGVLRGKIVAGRRVKAACQRHLDDLRDAKKKGLVFDKVEADRAIRFFSLLRHTTGEYAGEPFHLKPFQKFIVWCLVGWRRASDGMRRFRYALIELARGNGKTPFCAGLVLLLFAFDYPLEARAEAYNFATEKPQARRVFEEIARWIQADPHLAEYLQVFKSRILAPDGGSLEPMSTVGKTKDGLIPHVISFDEFHALRDYQRELWEKLTSAMGKRRQPMLIIITTAGDETSELWIEHHEMCCQIVDRGNNVEADDWFVFIAEIDEEDDPLDEAVWPKANPLLEHGVVKIDHLRSMAALAKIDPYKLQELTRYHCNRMVTSDVKVVTAEMCATGMGELPSLAGRSCHGAYDGGWKEDLAAFALAFPLDPVEVEGVAKRRVAVTVDCWVPQDGTRNLATEPWTSWIRGGWLRPTPGKITDTEAIHARVAELQKQFGIRTIAADPNNCREFGSRVQTELGIDAFWFGQVCGKYNEPTRELLAMMHEGRLLHGGNPLLLWALQNMILRTDHRGYVMPDKERSKEKIDPAVAVIMALSEVMFAEQAPKPTGMVYVV